MHEVAIVGAGELGGSLAHVLARRTAARAIRLIDEQGRVAEGKALDLTQAASLERCDTAISGATDLITAAGASVVVLADRVGGTEWRADEALLLLKRIRDLAPRAVIVCAGESQRELVERGARELRIPRALILGSAPEALTGGARGLVALACNGAPQDVSIAVLGVPPAHIVVSWERATIAGLSLEMLLDEPGRRRLVARIAALWPPGPYALASAAAKVVDGLLGRSRRLACCFVAPDDTTGIRKRAAALPVRLGPAGIVEVVLPPLSAAERVALDNAVLL